MKKPKRKTLRAPTFFKWEERNQWVVDYQIFDEDGKRKNCRKTFVKDLRDEGIEPSLSEQKRAAKRFAEEKNRERRKDERLARREREQVYLNPAELREAKAAFAVFHQIPAQNKSLVDAVLLYRKHLRLSIDSPKLSEAIRIFLGHKYQATEEKILSLETFRTQSQKLNNLLNWFCEKGLEDIRLGDVTSHQLIDYFESKKVSSRTKRNYFTDILGFFNDAANPKDKNRFINENPMDGVAVYYKKQNIKALKVARDEREIPVILNNTQVIHAISIAIGEKDKGFLGFTILGLFLGLRPSEIYGLFEQENHWEESIKLDEGFIKLNRVGKMRDRRNIEISENCFEWLAYMRDTKIPVCYNRKKRGTDSAYGRFRARAFLDSEESEKLIRLRRYHKTKKAISEEDKAFMGECQKRLRKYEDVLRHTYGTNYFYKCGFNKNQTVEQMGNSGEMFLDHYKGLVETPKSFEKYWQIVPSMFGL